ncbi:kynureninase [Paenibacillus sp. MWE-103]|uniref:Kynureninase n=1 Tax=Paenibacillus artemisiicola TaxID=1172618 RepID=A0ABS3W7P5_9BACL|nr:kynureninase [Paenibacillus artemisiicola]MBO7744314.1 kynureninase [Paenibacillus artemisiicola]
MFDEAAEPTLAYAERQDRADGLARFREAFYLKPGTVYMDGNSLGLLSKPAERTFLEALEDWKEYGIDGWTRGRHPWFALSERLGGMMAGLVGADADEVIVTGSATVNLHQLVATFYRPHGARTKLLADELNFPSDLYALQSQLAVRGFDPDGSLVCVKSPDGRFLDEDAIIEAMTEEIALIVLPSVLYRSGQLLDMERLTADARRRGIPIGFDCCHSVGAVPHAFDAWGVDFAFWCSYKHLNGGPGCPGGLYVNRRHLGTRPGLAGWFGSRKDRQFDMASSLTPAESAGAYQIGTPHVLSLAPLIGALGLVGEAGIEAIRRKSLGLTRYLMGLIGQELAGFGFRIGSPVEDARRGGHVGLEHDEAARICKALKERGNVPDFRAPNMIRLAPAALYTSYREVWDVVQVLRDIMEKQAFKAYPNERDIVA